MSQGAARKCRRGMTLIEALVAVSISLVVMGLVASVFRVGTRSTASSEEKMEMLISTATLADSLRSTLVSSARSGNTFHYLSAANPPENLALSIISTKDLNGVRGWDSVAQKPLYQSYSVFYHDQTTQSIRETSSALASTSVASPLSVTQLQSIVTSSPSRELARNVREFVLFDPVDGSVSTSPTNPLGLRWVMVNKRGAPKTIQLTCRVTMN